MQLVALKEEISAEIAPAPARTPTPETGAMLRLLTCGSVDDGKSTLIGRLLWDAAGLTEDQRAAVALASHNRGVDPNAVDAETAAETFKLNTDSRDRLRRLFEQNDEWQYSGTHNGPGRISPENRRDVLELIENLK